VRVEITGTRLPGRTFCQPDGSLMQNVHVAVHVRKDPEQLVPGDAEGAEWLVEVEVVRRDGLDFRGPAVQGRRG
jgi:Family of unknown function (DUF5990)